LWCVVSAIVVLQAHLGGTYKAAKERFLGVLIGSILGIALTYAFGSNPISVGAAVALTIIICSFFQLQESVRIACLTVVVIMVLSGLRPEIHLWWFGVCRFLDSCLGIFIAVVVAHTLWPEEATFKIQHNISKILTSMSKLFEISVNLETDAERHDKLFQALKDEVLDLFEDSSTHFDEAKLELALRQSKLEDWKLMIHNLESALEAIITLKYLKKEKLMLMLDEALLTRLDNFNDAAESVFQSLSKQLDSGEARHSEEVENDLTLSYQALKDDLIRLRGNRTTRQFDWKEIESFFVYFYSLGMVAEELFQTYKLLPRILPPQSPSEIEKL
jgi:uncharacterized membrane protein YgaE (UPF0421/DUF939 family)